MTREDDNRVKKRADGAGKGGEGGGNGKRQRALNSVISRRTDVRAAKRGERGGCARCKGGSEDTRKKKAREMEMEAESERVSERKRRKERLCR